jgi:ABC-2 type transport system permease protein
MYIRNRAAMFWVIIFPIGLMLVLGAIYGNQPAGPGTAGAVTAISFITPGLIVLSLMSNGLIGNSSVMAQYRERGILRRVQTTPLPVQHLILARVAMQSTLSVGQAALMIIVSILVFNARYDTAGLLEAIPAIVLSSIVFMSIGQAIAALVRKVDTVTVVSQAINFPLMFLGCLWIPVSVLPDWLQEVSKFLPSTLAAILVRTPMLSGIDLVALNIQPNVPLELCFAGLLAYLVASMVVSARFFKWS